MNIRYSWDSHCHLCTIRNCWQTAGQLPVAPAPALAVTDYGPGPGFMHELFQKYYVAGLAARPSKRLSENPSEAGEPAERVDTGPSGRRGAGQQRDEHLPVRIRQMGGRLSLGDRIRRQDGTHAAE